MYVYFIGSDILKLAIIIVLLLILALALTILYFDRKLVTLKQQYISLTKQYKNLREKYLKEYKLNNNILIKYSTPPTASTAITNANVSIYLAPLESCPIINTLNDKIEVTILDQAETNKEIWYYVSLPINSNINSKGWIKKCDFSIILNSSSDLVNRTR